MTNNLMTLDDLEGHYALLRLNGVK